MIKDQLIFKLQKTCMLLCLGDFNILKPMSKSSYGDFDQIPRSQQRHKAEAENGIA